MKKLNLSIRCCERIPTKCYKRAVLFHRGAPYCSKHAKGRVPKPPSTPPTLEKVHGQ